MSNVFFRLGRLFKCILYGLTISMFGITVHYIYSINPPLIMIVAGILFGFYIYHETYVRKAGV